MTRLRPRQGEDLYALFAALDKVAVSPLAALSAELRPWLSRLDNRAIRGAVRNLPLMNWSGTAGCWSPGSPRRSEPDSASTLL